MTRAPSYEEVLAELYALSARGIEPGLERMRAALARAGHPERDVCVVHVAGTNGKGSVSAMVATGLAAAGHRVGLYTSPHLTTLTERVRVMGGPPIERADVADGWARLRGALIGEGAPRLTFFEALTVLALELFRGRGLDVVVLEVGLGGRLDATNVFERPLACAITRIGIDHTGFLGSDLASIAREKAGILRAGVPAVIGPQREEARLAIEREASRVGAPLRWAEPGRVARAGLSPRLPGAHQRENAAIALGVLEALSEQGLSADPRAAVEEVEWPGRLERVEANGPFLLDAAHNADGCEALAAHLASRPRRRVLVFGAMADKDWRAMLAILRPHVDAVVCAAPPLSRAERPEVIAAACGGHPAEHARHAVALARELAGDDEVVVAGSIYLMGEIRGLLLGLEADPPIAM
ncbi:MAG: bifunctional folylpolyglutamate synthase/dihydrofolate synthase [Sandaracinaceae bacterium]|nr:bifunctional folylpolyglutamate synthase/dihydrofolate synthase [Sandaracinaceae bacterium]